MKVAKPDWSCRLAKETITLDVGAARELLIRACRNSGANDEVAHSICEAGLDAEMEGSAVTGASHLLLYCEAMRAGRVDGTADPHLENPTPVLFNVDSKGGFPHTGFDRSFEKLCSATRRYGITLFASHNGFTCGNLGYFARRLAERGLVALGATNAGPPMLAASGSRKPVFATNPIALAVPRANNSPLLIDQSSSQTAWINIHNAANRGESIPNDWAIDEHGNSTTDPVEALKGAMLAAGGARGANIALMVEVLAAGVTGANWSLDAPSFAAGDRCPGVGLLLIGIDPRLMFGDDFEQRIDTYLNRLERDFNVYIPGRQRAKHRVVARNEGILLDRSLFDQFTALAGE